jgi:hypothetical protein
MTTPQERQRALQDILDQSVLVIDGAMGTMIHQAPLAIETDYLGRENCSEFLVVTRPDVIRNIHRAHLCRMKRRSRELLTSSLAWNYRSSCMKPLIREAQQDRLIGNIARAFRVDAPILRRRRFHR